MGKVGNRKGEGEACVAVTQCVVHLTRLTQRAQSNEFECFRNSLKWLKERGRERESEREGVCVFVFRVLIFHFLIPFPQKVDKVRFSLCLKSLVMCWHCCCAKGCYNNFAYWLPASMLSF